MGVEAGGADSGGHRRLTLVSWPVLVTLVVLVLGWRSYELIVYPTMRVEDGAKIYAYFHDRRGIGEIFRFKSGYMPLLPNLLGYLSVRLPPRVAPYFMALAPTALSVFAYTSFFWRRFRAVVAEDGVRFVTCIALALAPVGQFFLVSHTDFSIWNALFCAVLWAWVPLPASPWRATLAVVGQGVLVWSHPISIVAAPINAAQLWFAKDLRQRIGQGAMLVGHVLHLAFGLDHSFTTRTVGAGAGDFPLRFVQYEHRALARALFGPRLLEWLRHHGVGVAVAGTVLVLGAAAWIALRNVARLRVAVLLAGYSLTGLVVAVAASRVDRQLDHGIRYLYVQSLFAVMLIVFVVLGSMRSVRWSSLRVKAFRLLGHPAAYAALVALSFGLHNLGMARRYREGARGDNARRVAECMARLAALQEKHGGPCGFTLRCDKPDDWDIVFRPPRCRGRRR